MIIKFPLTKFPPPSDKYYERWMIDASCVVAGNIRECGGGFFELTLYCPNGICIPLPPEYDWDKASSVLDNIFKCKTDGEQTLFPVGDYFTWDNKLKE